jgi:hypothetical protein
MGGFVRRVIQRVAPTPAPAPPAYSAPIQKSAVEQATSGPTDIEIAEQDALKRKRRGRRATMLTGATGVQEEQLLSTKTLLG